MLNVRINVSILDDHILKQLAALPEPKLSLREIAVLANCSRITAFRAINRLESAGRIRRTYAGGAAKTLYEVVDADD